jgi:undecaprenyl-diphosphatase
VTANEVMRSAECLIRQYDPKEKRCGGSRDGPRWNEPRSGTTDRDPVNAGNLRRWPRRHDERVPIFTRLNRLESDLVERHLPGGPAPRPLLVVNVAANGSRLWFGVAALMALRPSLRRTAVEGVVAALLAAGVTQIVNRLVGRPRPPADHPARRALPRQPVTPAFPSSHTAVAAAFTTAVARRRPRLGAALAPLAATLAYGRVRLRVHWPTDVLGGAVLGTATGWSAQRVTTAVPVVIAASGAEAAGMRFRHRRG